MDSLERKGKRALKTLKWILVFILISVIAIPGLIISLQYSSDSCVTKTSYINVELDQWLLLASLSYVTIMLLSLPCTCCEVEKVCSRLWTLIFSLILAAWGAVGIYLIANSDLKSCQHDSLWIMTLISITCLCLYIVLQIMYRIYSYCSYRQQQSLSGQPRDNFGWLDDERE